MLDNMAALKGVKLRLESKLSGIEHFVEIQRNYYPIMLQGMEEARHARHDLRHHINALQSLMAAESYSEMKRYLSRYGTGLSQLAPLNYCENFVVDVILRHFAVLAERRNVRFEVDVRIPEKLFIDDVDLCLILSNLLENALEACIDLNGEKLISVTLKQVRSRFVLLVDNSFDGVVDLKDGKFRSRKRQEQEGIGLASVEAIVKRHSGNATFTPNIERKIFTSEIVL